MAASGHAGALDILNMCGVLGALFASAITLYLNELGLAYAPCVFAAGVSAIAGATASRLAFRVAPEILRGGIR